MTATRIPDLTAITAAGTANDDFFVIFDSSTNTTKKILKSELSAMVQTDLGAAALLTKLLTVDGPGSLLDADTLDGLQASAFAQLSGAAFTGPVSSTAGLDILGLSVFGKIIAGEIQANVLETDASGVSRALVLNDRGTQIFDCNTMTVPAGVFSKGNWIVLHGANIFGSGCRVVRGSGLTMYFEGVNVAEVWCDVWSSAVIIFDSATVCRVVARGSTSPPP